MFTFPKMLIGEAGNINEMQYFNIFCFHEVIKSGFHFTFQKFQDPHYCSILKLS